MTYPIRTELEILPADEIKCDHYNDHIIIDNFDAIHAGKKSPVIGWKVSEHIGIGVINTRALSKLFKSK